MAKQPNTKMIGLFMISGMVLFLGIVGLFLKNRFFTDSSNTLVMYFDESIRGLSVGSSVLFNGVEIGRVSKIQLVTNVSDLSFRVPVYVQLTEYRSSLSDKSFHSRKDLLNELIDKGLRARLGTQNYLTGQLIIELVMQPESPVNLLPSAKSLRIFRNCRLRKVWPTFWEFSKSCIMNCRLFWTV